MSRPPARHRWLRRAPLLAGALVVTAVAVVIGLMLAGQGERQPAAHAPASTAPPTSTAPPAPKPAPRVGSCHRLGFSAATRPTAPDTSVRCGQAHTSVTYYVGTIDPIVDGHLMAVDSHAVQHQLAQQCPRRLPAYVGGDLAARRMSRFEAVWFGPTVHQAQLGARWFRCDLVALGGRDSLASLPARARGVLDQSGALDRFGTCGTDVPTAKDFQTVICSRRHSWRVESIIGLPAGTRFLGKAAGAAADDQCKSVASARAQGALKFTWSFAWPTRDQWDAGQRYGYCWLPTP